MKEDTISGPAFEGGSCSDGNRFAGAVANSHHDFQPK